MRCGASVRLHNLNELAIDETPSPHCSELKARGYLPALAEGDRFEFPPCKASGAETEGRGEDGSQEGRVADLDERCVIATKQQQQQQSAAAVAGADTQELSCELEKQLHREAGCRLMAESLSLASAYTASSSTGAYMNAMSAGSKSIRACLAHTGSVTSSPSGPCGCSSSAVARYLPASASTTARQCLTDSINANSLRLASGRYASGSAQRLHAAALDGAGPSTATSLSDVLLGEQSTRGHSLGEHSGAVLYAVSITGELGGSARGPSNATVQGQQHTTPLRAAGAESSLHTAWARAQDAAGRFSLDGFMRGPPLGVALDIQRSRSSRAVRDADDAYLSQIQPDLEAQAQRQQQQQSRQQEAEDHSDDQEVGSSTEGEKGDPSSVYRARHTAPALLPVGRLVKASSRSSSVLLDTCDNLAAQRTVSRLGRAISSQESDQRGAGEASFLSGIGGGHGTPWFQTSLRLDACCSRAPQGDPDMVAVGLQAQSPSQHGGMNRDLGSSNLHLTPSCETVVRDAMETLADLADDDDDLDAVAMRFSPHTPVALTDDDELSVLGTMTGHEVSTATGDARPTALQPVPPSAFESTEDFVAVVADMCAANSGMHAGGAGFGIGGGRIPPHHQLHLQQARARDVVHTHACVTHQQNAHAQRGEPSTQLLTSYAAAASGAGVERASIDSSMLSRRMTVAEGCEMRLPFKVSLTPRGRRDVPRCMLTSELTSVLSLQSTSGASPSAAATTLRTSTLQTNTSRCDTWTICIDSSEFATDKSRPRGASSAASPPSAPPTDTAALSVTQALALRVLLRSASKPVRLMHEALAKGQHADETVIPVHRFLDPISVKPEPKRRARRSRRPLPSRPSGTSTGGTDGMAAASARSRLRLNSVPLRCAANGAALTADLNGACAGRGDSCALALGAASQSNLSLGAPAALSSKLGPIVAHSGGVTQAHAPSGAATGSQSRSLFRGKRAAPKRNGGFLARMFACFGPTAGRPVTINQESPATFYHVPPSLNGHHQHQGPLGGPERDRGSESDAIMLTTL